MDYWLKLFVTIRHIRIFYLYLNPVGLNTEYIRQVFQIYFDFPEITFQLTIAIFSLNNANPIYLYKRFTVMHY